MRIVSDTWLVFRRSLALSLRNPPWLIVGLIQPLVYLLLFAPVLTNLTSMPGFPAGSAFNTFVPGLLVMTAGFGTMFVGFAFIDEVRSGVVERMRVTPMSRTAGVLGRTLRDIVVFMVQGLILIVASVPFGLHVEPLGVVVAMGLLALIGIGLGPLSYALALKLGSEDALGPIVQAIALPLMLLSGVLLPMSLAPDWLRTIATFNPLYHAVEAMRALFNAQFTDAAVLVGIAWMAGLAVVSVAVSARVFNRATA
jgi:ABC-2 type transport system permease protein